MELDKDCVRDVLLTIEEEIGVNRSTNISDLRHFNRLKNYDISQITYCVKKLHEADFISEMDYIRELPPTELTFKGHEFLDTIRDSDVWDKTKQASSAVSTVSLAILADLASSFIKQKLNLS
ncbi:DUF2513 domain-containing protein [Bacillus altitudinis]|uniref:DUF2513 domain-containing protein n=1 Tax=Bacillus altitudinis TaxID=293387 RepID=UPI001FB81340|nr:DUF2513 domain-containing protein [Bacillus altitudinis]UOG06774.1 DUF2513 domain-containing protein [Bacillus altitudinis]